MSNRVVIVVEGGCVSEVFSDGPAPDVLVIDVDDLKALDGASDKRIAAYYNQAVSGLEPVRVATADLSPEDASVTATEG